MSKWTLRQQRTRQLPDGETQEHSAALRAARYALRHAWQFHGAGVADALSVLTALQVPAERAFGDAVCLCTHPRSTHNLNGLCIALPGVLGCGCMGWSEKRPAVAPAQCPDCTHAHVEGQNCMASMGPGFCGCTG